MCSGPFSSAPSKSEKDYQAEDDHRTLSRAAEIQADTSRMARVKTHHRKETRRLSKVGRSLRMGKR